MTAADSRARAAVLVVGAEAWDAALAAPDDGGSAEESDLHFIVVRLAAAAGLASADEAGSAQLDRVDGWLQRLSAEFMERRPAEDRCACAGRRDDRAGQRAARAAGGRLPARQVHDSLRDERGDRRTAKGEKEDAAHRVGARRAIEARGL